MRVLCIVDSYRWALYNRAVSLKKHLLSYKFDIIHFEKIKKINFDNYDIIYVLNWPIWGFVKHKVSGNRGYRLVTTVCSHIGRPNAKDMRYIFDNFDKISTSNDFLYKEFRPVYGKKVVNTPFGVESGLFAPKTTPSDYRYTFGWVGNLDRPVKRFDEIKNVFSSLDGRYRLKVATNKSKFSREKMVDFYNSVGTVICFSKSEGTPNPILEAASCGRAIISTRVGCVPALCRGMDDNIFVRNTSELKKHIVSYSNSPRRMNLIGSSLRRAAHDEWSWKDRSKKFNKLFLEK